jgi:hypothetical protein
MNVAVVSDSPRVASPFAPSRRRSQPESDRSARVPRTHAADRLEALPVDGRDRPPRPSHPTRPGNPVPSHHGNAFADTVHHLVRRARETRVISYSASSAVPARIGRVPCRQRRRPPAHVDQAEPLDRTRANERRARACPRNARPEAPARQTPSSARRWRDQPAHQLRRIDTRRYRSSTCAAASPRLTHARARHAARRRSGQVRASSRNPLTEEEQCVAKPFLQLFSR